MNHMVSNEYRIVPFRANEHGTWINEWLLHQGCNDRYSFTGYVYDGNAPEHEYFIQYRYMIMNVPEQTQKLRVSITDLKTGSCYFYEEDEYISIDEIGVVRTNSSIILPSFDDQGLFLHVRTKSFSFRLRMTSCNPPVWCTEPGARHGGTSSYIESGNICYSLSQLATKGKLFFHKDDGTTTMVKCEGRMWFDKEYGPNQTMGAIIKPERVSAGLLAMRK